MLYCPFAEIGLGNTITRQGREQGSTYQTQKCTWQENTLFLNLSLGEQTYLLFSCCFPTRAHSPLDPPQLLLRVFKFDDLEQFLFAVRAEDAAGDLAEELLEHRGDGVDGEGVDVDEAALKTEECKVKAPDTRTRTCITYSEVYMCDKIPQGTQFRG